MGKKETQQQVVATKPQQESSSQAIEDAANMNIMAQFVNHLLTPGSALSGTMQTAFNIIMVVLFMVWGVFLASMPDSIHVWIFGALILGLTLSTNWFLNEVIKINAEIAEEEKKKKALEEAENKLCEEPKVALEDKKQITNQEEASKQQQNKKEEKKKEEDVEKKRSEKMKGKRETKKEM
jgi:hypothetical protein